MHIGNRFTKNAVKDKRHRSVNGSILLPLALRCRLLCVGALGIFVALAMPFMTAPTVFADTASDAVTVSFPSTPFTLDTTPSATGHQSEAPASITVSGQGSWGYTFSITSDSASNDLTSDGHTLPSISSEKDTVADFDDNTWGFKITGGTTKSTKFRPGPTKDAPTEIDATEGDIKSTTYELTLGAKVDGTLPSGTYSGNFTFTVTAKTVAYSVSYNLNDGTGGPSPNPQTGSTTDATINLSSAAPTRAGYIFQGWCSVSTSNESCDGQVYQPDKPYSLSSGSNTITLYAMWKQDGTHYNITYNFTGGDNGPNTQSGTTTQSYIYLDESTPTRNNYWFVSWCNADNTRNPLICSGETYSAGQYYSLSNGADITLYAIWGRIGINRGDLGTMQTFNCSSSQLTSEHDYGTVKDTRDNSIYTIRKLKDGNCWMIDNLRLQGSRTLTPADSDVSSNFSLPASVDSFASGSQPQINTKSIDVTVTSKGGSGPAGVYYDWYAATAGTGIGMTEGDASSSICPRGWHLPTGGGSGQLRILANKYRSGMVNPNGPNFLLAGWYSGKSAVYQNSRGYYSTSKLSFSSFRNTSYVDSLYINASLSFTYESVGRNIGCSIRCVAEQ